MKVLRWLGGCAILIAANCAKSAPPSDPPDWQRELEAARLSETTIALLANTRPDDAVEPDRRLGELYRRLTAKYPDRAAVRQAAGDHFWRTGETAAAVAEWQAAQVLDPHDAETASALGGAWLRDGRAREASEQLQRAVDARPGVARYHFDLANVLFLFRHELAGSSAHPSEHEIFRAALAHFRRASELAPDNVGYAQAYAETFYGVPDPDWTAALAAWDHVRSLNAAAPDFANGHLARVSLRMGNPTQAEAYLELIRGAAYEPVKTNLLRQAEAMKRATATPAPSP